MHGPLKWKNDDCGRSENKIWQQTEDSNIMILESKQHWPMWGFQDLIKVLTLQVRGVQPADSHLQHMNLGFSRGFYQARFGPSVMHCSAHLLFHLLVQQLLRTRTAPTINVHVLMCHPIISIYCRFFHVFPHHLKASWTMVTWNHFPWPICCVGTLVSG